VNCVPIEYLEGRREQTQAQYVSVDRHSGLTIGNTVGQPANHVVDLTSARADLRPWRAQLCFGPSLVGTKRPANGRRPTCRMAQQQQQRLTPPQTTPTASFDSTSPACQQAVYLREPCYC